MGLLRKLIGVAAACVTLGAAVSSCSNDKHAAPLSQLDPTSHPKGTGGKAGSMGTGGSNVGAAGTTPGNCGKVACRGHTHCVMPSGGADPTCACDTGYVRLDQDGNKLDDSHQEVACTVDKTCIRIRFLESDSCRYAFTPPAVGLFFAVDYCAGTAVLNDVIKDPNKAFTISQGEVGKALMPLDSSSVETSATIISGRPIESFLTLVIDVSGDLSKQTGIVTGALDQLQTVIGGLSDQNVSISVVIFGRYVAERVPFTTDLSKVNDALAAIAEDPAGATSVVGTNGTSIHTAVEYGIHSVERIQALRHAVTLNGVLTSGTVVIITDGDDNSSVPVPADLIKATKANVITVGVSNAIDDADLTAIGRDGSFLAPTKADLADTFSEIATRIRNYPKRAYFLGYCSTATTGIQEVQVSLAGTTSAQGQTTCTYDANQFISDPSAVCDKEYFTGDTCNQQGKECGDSLLACGFCHDDQCCADYKCQAPSAVEGSKPGCRDQQELCNAGGLVCNPVQSTSPQQFACGAPAKDGKPCNLNARCDPVTEYCATPPNSSEGVCAMKTKVTLGEDGDSFCEDADGHHDGKVCPELNCAQRRAEAVNDPFVCLPRAKAFERCGGKTASAECEPGTACQPQDPAHMDVSICKPRRVLGCSSDKDCVTGYCKNIIPVGMDMVGTCYSTAACYFSWDSKINQ